METSNVQFSQEKHDKYEKHDKHIDDDRPFRVTLKAADENSALYKDRMSGSGQTNVVDIDSRGEVRLGGPASSKPESDLKELAKDLGNIGKEVGKGMLSMLGWAAHEALEAAKKRKLLSSRLPGVVVVRNTATATSMTAFSSWMRAGTGSTTLRLRNLFAISIPTRCSK